MTDSKRSTRSILPPWLSGLWGAIAILSSLYMLVYLAWTQFHWGGDANIKLIGDLINLPIELVAVLGALYVIRQKDLEPRLRRMWLLLGLGFLAYFIGDTIWGFLENVLNVSPFPAVSDIFYLLFAPLVVAGLLNMPSAPLSRQERRQFAFDFLITMITTILLMWYFIIQPTATSNAGDLLTQSVAVAYPIMDVVIIGGIVGALLRKPNRDSRSVLWLLFVGTLFFVSGDIVFGYTSLAGTYVTGGLIDTFWSFAFLFFLFAALRQVYRSPADSPDLRFMKILDGIARLLPSVATTLGGIVAVIVVATNFNARSGWLIAEVILAVVVLLAIIIRQFPDLSLRLKVIMTSVGITVITVAILASYLLNQIYQNVYNTTVNQITTESHEQILSFQTFLSGHSQDAIILSQLPDLNNLIAAEQTGADPAVLASDTAAFRKDLQAFFDVHAVYDNVRFIDATGREVVKVNSNYISSTLQNKATRPFFAIPAKMPSGSLYMSPLELEQDLGQIIIPRRPVLRFATPVYYNNKLAGVVVVNILAENFLNNLSDPVHHVMMVDQNGYYLYDNQLYEANRTVNKLFGGPSDLNTGNNIANDLPSYAPSLLSGKSGSFVDHGNIYFYSPITILNGKVPSWFLVYEVPQAEIYAVANRTLTISLLILGAILLFATALAVYLGNSLIEPVISLTQTAQEAAQGDLSVRSNVKSKDEIGVLAAAFNQMTGQLSNLIGTLEKRVADRTQELTARSNDLEIAGANIQQRATQFEAIALIVKAINSVHQMDALLPQITSVISERLGYYHIGIFLNDESDQTAALAASNSEGGKNMLARGHRLRIGEQGIVGYVAATGTVRVARSVGEDAIYFNNPDLPETLSEMALPLRVGNQIVGVLDVQSKQTDAFSSEDISVLSLLADEVSLAIENTRLLESTRRSLSEAEALYRQYLHKAWSRFPHEENLVGYRSTISGSAPLETPVDFDANLKDGNKEQKETGRLVIPIKLRSELIGNLVIQAPQNKEWTRDQMDLVQAVADRVALSAENARLFDETIRRAERERMVTEITSKIRSTNNPEEMIGIALNELRNALGATQVQLIPQAISFSRDTKTSTDQKVDPVHNGNGAKK
jgi:GAF domain-containing protein/HAMP domain-containing protein